MIDFPEAVPCIVQIMTIRQNDLGEPIEKWVDDHTINAEIWPLRGNQTRGKMGVTEKSTHEAFTVDTVKSNTRIVRGVETFLVGHVEDWDTHRTAILERVTV